MESNKKQTSEAKKGEPKKISKKELAKEKKRQDFLKKLRERY